MKMNNMIQLHTACIHYNKKRSSERMQNEMKNEEQVYCQMFEFRNIYIDLNR